MKNKDTSRDGHDLNMFIHNLDGIECDNMVLLLQLMIVLIANISGRCTVYDDW